MPRLCRNVSTAEGRRRWREWGPVTEEGWEGGGGEERSGEVEEEEVEEEEEVGRDLSHSHSSL